MEYRLLPDDRIRIVSYDDIPVGGYKAHVHVSPLDIATGDLFRSLLSDVVHSLVVAEYHQSLLTERSVLPVLDIEHTRAGTVRVVGIL